jgi:hypothetical protein
MLREHTLDVSRKTSAVRFSELFKREPKVLMQAQSNPGFSCLV